MAALKKGKSEYMNSESHSCHKHTLKPFCGKKVWQSLFLFITEEHKRKPCSYGGGRNNAAVDVFYFPKHKHGCTFL